MIGQKCVAHIQIEEENENIARFVHFIIGCGVW
jgi:hypothetical protein